MKRILFALLVLLSASNLMAQHLDFMGVSIEGKISEFTDRMKPRFQLAKRTPDTDSYIFKGFVFGYEMYMQAAYTRKSHTVYKVTVTPKHINENAWLDSLTTHYGTEYQVTDKGLLWEKSEGKILLYKVEGYDPVLFYLDNEGLAKFSEEK